ncbi:MAG TPA: HSP20 family small heat-shock protein [Polyangia bacterium]|jgi:HSP20 family protein
MANLIRRRSQNEITPSMARDPLQLVRDLLRFDPFSAMMAIPGASEAQEMMFVPDFEVRETPDAYVFKADLPGVKQEDLDITVADNRLVVSGKREAETRNEGDRVYAYERAYGSFTRAFTLPEGVDAENVRAELTDGVLSLTVAKRPEKQPKKVELRSGGKEQQQAKAKA